MPLNANGRNRGLQARMCFLKKNSPRIHAAGCPMPGFFRHGKARTPTRQRARECTPTSPERSQLASAHLSASSFPCFLVPLFPCSLVPLFPCSLVPLFPRSLVPSFPRSLVPSFPCSLVPSFPCSLVPLFPCSLVPLFPCSLVPLFPRSLVPSFPCSLVPLFPRSLPFADNLPSSRYTIPIASKTASLPGRRFCLHRSSRLKQRP